MHCDTRIGPPNTTTWVHNAIRHYYNVKYLVMSINVEPFCVCSGQKQSEEE